jgi:hypothetical protein
MFIRSLLSAAFALLFSSALLHGQITKLEGNWSIMLDAGYNIPVSSSMRGSPDDVFDDVADDYNSKQYPFGEGTIGFNGGGHISYRFAESNWSPYVGLRPIFFHVDNFFQTATMFAIVWSAGAEYTLGTITDTWNAFGRAGLNSSWISGRTEYFGYDTRITPTIRFGFEGDIGGRWNIPRTPLSVEGAIGYAQINLIGKDYEAPAAQPPRVLSERALNDAADPNNPEDESKTIDYLSFRLGGRIWF